MSADALAIWQAGVDAVTPERLFADKVLLEGTRLRIDEFEVDLGAARELIIVGAGKAAAAMANALHARVVLPLRQAASHMKIHGWLNCPAGTFLSQLPNDIHLHVARPAGVNLPTEQAIAGTRQILRLVENCDQDTVVVCLLSGGGSALLVAPPEGITLNDKQAVSRYVAAAGGNIEQLNTIRRALSQVKGGGLARACRAGKLISIIISDVLGDPLDVIASGPTLLSAKSDARSALATLEELQLTSCTDLQNVVSYLRKQSPAKPASAIRGAAPDVAHIILGNNADAVDAAGSMAVKLGYRYVMQAARESEGDVMQVARTAAAATLQLAGQEQINCWISGGEPTVTLPAQGAGQGGRNQQLSLAVLQLLQEQGWPSEDTNAEQLAKRELVFLSGGTDGEDGPTAAAGAWFDRQVAVAAKAAKLDACDYLNRADAYHFFEQCGGLLLCGPTGTNVCDLRVALTR
ncbi:MAG: DUF4147 domain-containing protein [Pirellulaceae bacterium]